ncbi:class I SAM-dependent methyltransferase [Candidatus Micrarchaeota archaeon]|nr:class I SAM-dependent methyltransferase [Candidatus Micrarchaeota archaeon]
MAVNRSALQASRKSVTYLSMPKFARFVTSHIDEKGRIADLGSGPGNLWKNAPHLKSRVFSIDVVPNKGLSARGSSSALPFRDGSFDHVVSTFALEYMDRHKALSEMRRITRKNGKLILLLHHPDGPVIKSARQAYSAFGQLINLLKRIQRNNFETREVDEVLRSMAGQFPDFPETEHADLEATHLRASLLAQPINRWGIIFYGMLLAKEAALRKGKAGFKRLGPEIASALERFRLFREVEAPLGGEKPTVFSTRKSIAGTLRSHGFVPSKIREISDGESSWAMKAFGVVARKV